MLRPNNRGDAVTRSRRLLIVAATALVALAPVIVPAARAQDAAIPPLMAQINGGNWLPQQEAERLRDELFYQHAVHAYMTMLPALNVIGIRDGSEAAFAKRPSLQRRLHDPHLDRVAN